MLGAIIGDMVGAPYEFDRGGKTKEFPLWVKESHFTDDTVMTVAVAQALMNAVGGSDDDILAAVQASMQKWLRKWFCDEGVLGWLYVRHYRTYTQSCCAYGDGNSQPPRGNKGRRGNGERNFSCKNWQHKGRDKGVHRA